jgi:hypothetical protein
VMNESRNASSASGEEIIFGKASHGVCAINAIRGTSKNVNATSPGIRRNSGER